jgi:hypothetical protein
MNKLSKPASNCRTAKRVTTRRKARSGGVDHLVSVAAGICSYTNDFARAAETCQAPLLAKLPAAE